MNREILKKYLNNQCSEKEFEEFAMWVEKNANSKESKIWGFDYWKKVEMGLNVQDEKKYNSLLDKIHHNINLQQHKNWNNNFIRLSKWVTRIAAILFIPLVFSTLFIFSNNNFHRNLFSGVVDSLEVIAPIGSRTVVQLSDGTEVSLNYGSKIKYPQYFSGKQREVTITGEAFFKVAHNPQKPFVVRTGNFNVIALGTSFNLHAYPGDEIVSTTLVEGEVLLEKNIPGQKPLAIGKIEPGQHVEYHLKTGKVTSAKGATYKYIAWKEGKMVFDNTPITMVAQELSRKFNVDIEVSNDVKFLTYTVTFIDDPIFLILDLMAETTPIKYQRLPRKKLADGTFSKQKILIEKRT
jgi:transmembrane sensor